LTNNFTLPALTIAQIYKCRWQVERKRPVTTVLSLS
jgi:IS4 transposase